MDFPSNLIKAIGFVGGAIFLLIAFLQKRKAKKAAETWQTAHGTILTHGNRVRLFPSTSIPLSLMGDLVNRVAHRFMLDGP